METWPVALAAGLALGGLARRFSSPALPDPGPLPASVPVPRVRPWTWNWPPCRPGSTTGWPPTPNRGGSVFDRRDFYIGAALIKHPQGDLLAYQAGLFDG